MIDEAKELDSKYITSSREIERFTFLPTIDEHKILYSYHHLDEIFPFNEEEMVNVKTATPKVWLTKRLLVSSCYFYFAQCLR